METYPEVHGKQACACLGVSLSLSACPGTCAGVESAQHAHAKIGQQQHSLMKKNNSILCWLVAITSLPFLLVTFGLTLLTAGFS